MKVLGSSFQDSQFICHRIDTGMDAWTFGAFLKKTFLVLKF